MSDAGRAPNTTDFNPEFASRLQAFRDALTKAGIQTQIASGYRSPEYQNQMYQNHLAKAAGRSLPYPNVEAPSVVAPAWQSFHNYGIAADVTPANPADYPRMWDMANQFGLTALRQKDMDHFQMGGSLASNIAQYKLAGWRPDSLPAPTTGAIAYNGPSGGSPVAKGTQFAGPGVPQPKGTTVNAANAPVAGALASPYGNPFLDKLAEIESNNRNIPSTVDKDYPGQPGSKSQGYFQIDTPTWLTTAAKAGIDTKQFPNAMSAPPEVQAQVASLIPLNRFGGRTQRMLAQQFGTLDKSATIGSLASNFATPTAPGPADPSAIARGSTVNPPVNGAAPATAVAAADKPLWQKAFDVPTDAQGNPVAGGKSPFQQAVSAFSGQDKGSSLQQFKQAQEDEAPQGQVKNQAGPAPGARNTSPMGGALLPSVPQTYGQTLNSFSAPLTWNSAPPKAPQLPASGFQGPPGPQTPGMTLTSFQAPQGIGYGVDPNIGYGYG